MREMMQPHGKLSFAIIYLFICLACSENSTNNLDSAAVVPANNHPKTVEIRTIDDVTLQGSFYGRQTKSPGILLIHMCMDNASRADWNLLAPKLQNIGYNVLSIDLRGYGESGGDWPEIKSMTEFLAVTRSLITKDIDAAYNYLISDKNVDKSNIVVGGASCASILGIELAVKHKSIKSMAFLSGPFDHEAEQKFKKLDVPVFTAASENDTRAFQAMKRLFAASTNPKTVNIQLKGQKHGSNMFKSDPDLEDKFVMWLKQQL